LDAFVLLFYYLGKFKVASIIGFEVCDGISRWLEVGVPSVLLPSHSFDSFDSFESKAKFQSCPRSRRRPAIRYQKNEKFFFWNNNSSEENE
jgi:hypothetical protein